MRPVLTLAALLVAAPVVAAPTATTPVAATLWVVVPARSQVTFTAAWNGQTVQGRFGRFDAAIRFDPAHPAAASVDALIDLASATSNDATVNGSLPGDDWFAVNKTRQARFVARGFAPGKTPNSYVARGTLTLRGVAVPVALPFTLAIAGDTATMTGAVRLDRRTFRIGMESDAAGTWVAFAVPVTLRIVARRVKEG